jgi:flagellar protein FlbD
MHAGFPAGMARQVLFRGAYGNAERGKSMIRVTRLKGAPLVLNSDLIEHVEATPDTVIALTTGQKIMVLETPEEIVRRVVDFRRTVGADLYRAAPQADSGPANRFTEDRKGQ